MHRRSDSWTAPQEPKFHRSSDGWIRITTRISDAPDGLGNPGGPHQSIQRHRSWALDPAASASRLWDEIPADSIDARPVHRRVTRVFSAAHGSGIQANPHADTRGIVPVEIDALAFRSPVEIEVSRSSEGHHVSFSLPPDGKIYGLGEKTGGLDKRGRSWTFWNSDEPDHVPERDPLYQSIPVAYIFTPEGTRTIFVDSPATVYLDAGESEPEQLQIEVYDGACSVYVRDDRTLPAAVRAYTELTGRMPMPPEWALGFQQCRYSYFPESRVVEVAKRFRKEEIPCDVVYLDIHYMDGYRVFTWDSSRFPDPEAMAESLHELGFHLVTIVDPGVKVDPEYDLYRDGMAMNAFLSDATGVPYEGVVWPGDTVYPDFTDPVTREWWAKNHRELLARGVDGIWNDMNEPSDFSGDSDYRPTLTVPDDLLAGNEGRLEAFGRLHNAYANGMNEATRSAFSQLRPNERGFVLTRAGYAGIQRYAAIWTGDNHSWWEHVGMMIPMFTNLGLSGVAFVGGDAGGFQMNASPELYARWIAASCLTPFFRAHSELDSIDHEPWSFGVRVAEVARTFIGLRYRLLPYLYSLFEQASATGAPVMRPLVYEFPEDDRVHNRSDAFLVGSALLVAPVRERGVQERSVYLPAGLWYDFWTGTRILADGGTTVAADAPLERMPLYLRGGSVIPFEGLRQHTGEAGDGILRLLVAPDGSGRAEGTIYADEGEGFGYRDGAYWRAAVCFERGMLTVTVLHGDGAPALRWSRVEVVVVRDAAEGPPVAGSTAPGAPGDRPPVAGSTEPGVLSLPPVAAFALPTEGILTVGVD